MGGAKRLSPIPTSVDMDITALLLSMSGKGSDVWGRRRGEREVGRWRQGKGEKTDEKLNMPGQGNA